jgi:tetratricopeptide (TPR) repeat protein
VRVIFARGVLLLLLGSALIVVARLAIAETAFRLNPDAALNSRFWLPAGNLARYESSPDQLRVALSLNPRLSSAWIQLGLDAEADGNLEEVETDLLRAARVDAQYLPSWALANFYFRRGDAHNFWPWAERAAQRTFDDYRPLLRLADGFNTSPPQVARRLGGGAPLLRAYLDLLIGEGYFDSAREIAALLAAYQDPADRDRLAALAIRP